MFDEVRKELEELGWPNGKSMKGKSELKKRIEDVTSFLDPSNNTKLSQRLFCLYANIQHTPKCMECGEDCVYSTKKNRPDNIYGGWTVYCSKRCAYQSEEFKEKIKQTNVERYGVETPFQSEKIKEKIKQTNRKRYGVDHPLKSKEVKERMKKTNLERYGVENVFRSENVKEKIKQTNVERYGVRNPSQVGNIKEKKKRTSFERYGVEIPMQHEEVKERMKKTNLERYGVDSYSRTEEYKERYKQTSIERYGVPHPLQSDEVKSKTKQTNLERYGAISYSQNHLTEETLVLLGDPVWMEENYNEMGGVKLGNLLGVTDCTVYNWLKRHNIPINPNIGSSFGERQVASFIETLGFNFVTSDRTILDGKELDIYIPAKKVAIEFNGVYWHSDKFIDKKYHQEKSLACKDKGILLIHVWEDDWNERRHIVERKIKSKLGLAEEKVYARKTSICEVSPKEAASFMEKNHIQGKTGASVWLGLRHDSSPIVQENELVAVVGLKKTEDEGVWDLVRYATSCSVVGGFSKLLSYFKKAYEWKEIFTYAHLDYSHGGVYEKTGFEFSHITTPGMWYTRGGIRERREKFMKYKLPDILENFDPDLTERENMNAHGYNRIFDSGSIKYKMINKG